MPEAKVHIVKSINVAGDVNIKRGTNGALKGDARSQIIDFRSHLLK